MTLGLNMKFAAHLEYVVEKSVGVAAGEAEGAESAEEHPHEKRQGEAEAPFPGRPRGHCLRTKRKKTQLNTANLHRFLLWPTKRIMHCTFQLPMMVKDLIATTQLFRVWG